YPGHWERNSGSFDPLSTMRELRQCQPAEMFSSRAQMAACTNASKGRLKKLSDETFVQLGYRLLDDLAILPVLAECVVRAYRSDGGTVIAAVGIRADRAVSTTLLSLLAQDAVVVVSDAFVVEKAKKRVFATMLSTAKPSELVATLRARCSTLAKKHGDPVVIP